MPTTTAGKLWTVNDIQAAMRAAGSHWWDPGAMRFFGSRVLPEVYQGPGGVYFVTSDKQFDGTRGHTVRRYDPEANQIGDPPGDKNYVGTLTRSAAVGIAKRAAAGPGGGEIQTTGTPFRPVTEAEQFLADCRKHGNPKATMEDVKRIIDKHTLYHKQCEHECNGRGQRSRHAERSLLALGMALGATAVKLGSDPRGCVVKLVWADGATNDFGSEGWCVPRND